MISEYNNKVYTATGASRGIGLRLASQLLDPCALLDIADINNTALEAARNENTIIVPKEPRTSFVQLCPEYTSDALDVYYKQTVAGRWLYHDDRR